jgi:methyl-accepting chemotaxis protein
MSQINTASNKIVEVIGVIDEIAFQTNLLALNAAVEAARAGEQGHSFAVVASEVRNLASRSAVAAKEIKALIQDSVRKVNEGTKLVDESGEALGEIVTRVKKVTDVMADMANSSREQASGIEQVNRAVTAMDAMTQQNAALVEAAAAAAAALNEQATGLMKLIGHYRLS